MTAKVVSIAAMLLICAAVLVVTEWQRLWVAAVMLGKSIGLLHRRH